MSFAQADRMVFYRGGRSGEATLTWAQNEVLRGFLTSARPDGGELNPSRRISIPEGVRVKTVLTAVSRLVARHESLRTTYFLRDGEWRQRILADGCLHVRVHTVDDGHDATAHVERVLSEYNRTPFLNAVDQPIRVTLVVSARSRSIDVAVSVFHLSCDLAGIAILETELLAAVDGPLCDDPVLQMLDQARGQETAAGQATTRVVRHWTDVLMRAPRTSFPVLSGNEADWRVTSVRSRTLTEAVVVAARRTRTSPSSLLTAAIAFAMCRYSGNDRYTYLTWTHNRFHPLARRSVSQQAQTVVAEVRIIAASFYETAGAAGGALLRAYTHSVCDPGLPVSARARVEQDRGTRVELGVVNIAPTSPARAGTRAGRLPAPDVGAGDGLVTTTRSPRPGKQISHHFQASLDEAAPSLEFHVDRLRVPDADAAMIVKAIATICHAAASGDVCAGDVPGVGPGEEPAGDGPPGLRSTSGT